MKQFYSVARAPLSYKPTMDAYGNVLWAPWELLCDCNPSNEIPKYQNAIIMERKKLQ